MLTNFFLPQTKVLIGGVFALVLTLGLSRFAYTPLLPLMQEETYLGTASGGWLATIHYLGYLLGVLTTLKTQSLKSREFFYFSGLFLSVVSTFIMSLAENFLLWSIARFIAGFCGAAGIIIGAGLVMQWITENTDEKPQMGKYFVGVGIGIVITALCSILFKSLNFTWSQQWFAYGLIATFCFLPAWTLRPKFKAPEKTFRVKQKGYKGDRPNRNKSPVRSDGLYKLLAMYFFAGFAFVISATFTVAIVKLNPEINMFGNLVWLLVGLSSIPSVVIWDFIEAKYGMLKTLSFAMFLHSISLLLNIFDSNLSILLLAAFLFGISNLGIVSLTMTLAGRTAPHNPGQEMARLTVAFAIALVIGPSIAGTLAEVFGTYFISLLFSAVLLIFGIILLWLRELNFSKN
tara:strand:+ start:4509 stop:5717 length:1209 start_codon:yes stop_codon:yes gene_type:complete